MFSDDHPNDNDFTTLVALHEPGFRFLRAIMDLEKFCRIFRKRKSSLDVMHFGSLIHDDGVGFGELDATETN